MKKLFLFALFALTACCAMAQRYTITGKAPAGTDTITLKDVETRALQYIHPAADGTFSHAVETEGRPFYEIFAGKTGFPLMLDGDITVNFENQTAKGTPENEIFNTWNARVRVLQQRLLDMETQYGQAQADGTLSDSLMFAIRAEYQEVFQSYIKLVQELCATEPKAKAPAYFLAQVFASMPREEALALVDARPACMETVIMQRFQPMWEAWRRQAIGVMFTDIKLADTSDEMHPLSEYVGHGNYVLLDFWASWCGPCRAEMPKVKALYEKYHAKGFEIVGLSLDADKAAWVNAIKKLDLPWPHLSDLKGWKSAAAKLYGVDAIPATILLDPQGRIIATRLRATALGEKLQELYGE